MKFTEHLFHATFFSCNLEYIMSYFFFLVSMLFITIFTTQTNIFNFGNNTPVIRFFIITFWFFLSLFISRIICYKKTKSEESNVLFYYEDV